MQLKQLVEIVNLINEKITNQKLVDNYNQLTSQLKQAAKNPNQNVTDKIVELKESIYQVHKSIEEISINSVKRKLLDEFGATKLLGANAINTLDEIFNKHQANPSGAANEIQSLLNETKKIQSRINNLKSGLGPLLEREKELIELEEDEGLLQLIFEGNVTVYTINDLEESSKTWRKIVHSFSRLSKTPSRDAKIYSIEQGSLIIELIGVTALIGAIAKSTTLILGVYEKYLSIKKHALEIEKLEIDNGEIKDNLMEKAEKVIENAADEIALKLLKENGFKKNGEDFGEVRNVTKASIKDIFHFVENGGKIDFYSDEEGKKQSEEQKALAESFKTVRQIENKLDNIKEITDGAENDSNGREKSDEDDSKNNDNEK